MSEVRIAAEPRTEFGKGAARRIRRANKVPAVLYGHGTPPRHVSLPGHELMLALKTANVLMAIEVDGGQALVIPREVQRDPIRGFVEHVDLLVVERGEKVTVEVPVRVIGEPAPGGLLETQMTTVPLEVEATHIPEVVEVTVAGLEVGTAVHARDLALPSGAVLSGDPESVIVNVVSTPTAEQVEAELATAEAEAGITHEEPTTAAEEVPAAPSETPEG